MRNGRDWKESFRLRRSKWKIYVIIEGVESSWLTRNRYFMWRPVRGVFEPGKTTLPWETEPFVPKLS